MKNQLTRFEAVYDKVRQIPKGQVATYQQIAKLVPNCSPRMVGYALAALNMDSDVPWHRVINSQGKISPRTNGDGSYIQRELLADENIHFDSRGKVDLFSLHLWPGPNLLDESVY